MDGPESAFFLYFKSLFLKGLMELKKHVDTFVKIVEIMSKGSKMPCFTDDPISIITSFRERFHINKSESELVKIVDELISYSLSNWRTSQYDYYQKMTNGIIP
jgi:phosphatidylinositol kinase/protein kinase (PI-3  family)